MKEQADDNLADRKCPPEEGRKAGIEHAVGEDRISCAVRLEDLHDTGIDEDSCENKAKCQPNPGIAGQ